MSLFASWLSSPAPDAAVEIAPDRVSALILGRRGVSTTVQAHATEPLAPGAVSASLTATNIVDPGAVASALREVLSRVGGRLARVALVVPDTVARVSIVRFDRVATFLLKRQPFVRRGHIRRMCGLCSHQHAPRLSALSPGVY